MVIFYSKDLKFLINHINFSLQFTYLCQDHFFIYNNNMNSKFTLNINISKKHSTEGQNKRSNVNFVEVNLI